MQALKRIIASLSPTIKRIPDTLFLMMSSATFINGWLVQNITFEENVHVLQHLVHLRSVSAVLLSCTVFNESILFFSLGSVYR
jgi:hypothetical protein